MNYINSMLKRCLNNFLNSFSFIIKIILVIVSIVLFCVGNAKVGTDQTGLVGMIPLGILAIYLTLRYSVNERNSVIKEFPNRVKSMTYAVLFLIFAFLLMTMAYGMNRLIDEYNTGTIDFNQYILHDAAAISLFFYIEDLIFSKTFYIVTYRGVSNCSCIDKNGKYTWKYLLFYMLRTFDIVIFFFFFYLLFFIFKNGIYHTVQGGGIVFIFVIIFSIIPFVLDFLFARHFVDRFREITALEDEIAEKQRKENDEKNKKRLHELFVKEKIRHDNTKLISGCRYTYYDFIRGFVEDVDQLYEMKYFKSEFPDFVDLNLGGVINNASFNSLYGYAGDIKTYKWTIKYKLETLKNNEYQLNIHLYLKNEKDYIMNFTKMRTYNSNANAIELEAKKVAQKDYRKAPSSLKKDQVYDDGSFFGEKVEAAVSYSDFEEAELALRKKEIDNEKRKEEHSKYLQILDAEKNYFAHLCDFVSSEFNRVQVFKMDVDNNTAHEVKKLKLSFGEVNYLYNQAIKNEKIFIK